MGDRFYMTINIGGSAPDESAEDLLAAIAGAGARVEGEIESLDSVEHPSDLNELVSENGTLDLMVEEASYDDFENIAQHAFKIGLSYDFHCDPKYEYPGTYEYYRPAMKRIIQLEKNGQGDIVIPSGQVERLINGYCVSIDEMRRALSDEAGHNIPPLPDFNLYVKIG